MPRRLCAPGASHIVMPIVPGGPRVLRGPRAADQELLDKELWLLRASGGGWPEELWERGWHVMTIMDQPAPHPTITQRLLGLAGARGEKPALVGGPALGPTQRHSYADFARLVRAAAAGLGWRGVRSGDAVGVYAPDAVSYAVAVHAIRAAGGVPSPVCHAATVAEMAAQLTDCGARMLITGPPLLPAALAAVERSRVRQVLSFWGGPGEGPVCSFVAPGG